jgi:hypothetical protein
MANTTNQNQDKEANPIAEIFDEVFTLMQDLETRSVAVVEYLQGQGGATDEKLAPYLDRAAAASDVRWRAARARMEHLLAAKPKSSTDVDKDDGAKSAAQQQDKGKDPDSGTKSQGEKQQGGKSDAKDLGKELSSAPTGTDKPPETKDEKSQTVKPATDANAKDGEKGSDKRKDVSSKSSDAESQAATLADGSRFEAEKGANAKPEHSESGNSSNPRASDDKQQSQKATK